MKASEELYEEIEEYLSGKLERSERKAFEERISSDPKLADEVRLHQELSSLMEEDIDEKAFRENLKMIDRETKIGSNNRTPILLLAVILLFAGIAWMYSQQEVVVQEPEKTTNIVEKEEQIEKKQVIEPVQKIEQEKLQKREEKKVVTPTPLPKIEKTSQPIAMTDYSTNPLLESLINNNRRSTEIAFTIDRKQSDVKLSRKGDSLNFHIAGNAVGEEALSEGSYNLHIFSNQVEEYRKFLPKYTQELKFDKKEDMSLFEIKVGIALEPGLYYYLIEDSDTEELFFVEKFRISS